MRRFLPLLLLTAFLLIVITGAMHFSDGLAGRQEEQVKKHLTLYTTIPVEQAALLAQEFEKIYNIRVIVIPLTENDLFNRLVTDAPNPQGDVIMSSSSLLKQARNGDLLSPFSSEQNDIIPDRFKDEDDFWMGLWIDPIVFAAHSDYISKAKQVPESWDDLTQDEKLRLSMTDFIAAEASASLLYTLVAEHGEEKALSFLKEIHPKIIQYAKFLATPVRIAGMGEADIAIAVHSEALRYVKEGFPLQIIYPQDGTAYFLTGAALVKSAPHPVEAKQFLEWIVQEEAQSVLEKNKLFFVSTNPGLKQFKEYGGRKMKLFDNDPDYTPEKRQEILDTWVHTIRFGK